MSSRARKFSPGAWGITAAILVALPLGFAGPARLDEAAATMQAALAQWQSETTSALNIALTEASVARLMRPNDAIVQVTFSIGKDGKADNIKVLPGDGNWAARRAAIFAVRQLENLERAPLSNPRKTRFLANIIFYERPDARERLIRKLRLSEAARLGSSGDARTYLAIGN